MQTFVPSEVFSECARVLDMRRLGKQRVETLQILNAMVSGGGKGWVNHPATKMWGSNIHGLIAYGVSICDEWIKRGYKDTCRDKILNIAQADYEDLPVWWGDERVHSSHRANLLRKMPEHYSQYGWTEDPETPYFWPMQEV